MQLLICIIYYLVAVYGAPSEPNLQLASTTASSIRIDVNSKECTYGPTYWCKNITTAAGCRATKHCIQTVWEHQILPPDHSSICETCIEMVKEARDQLQSNETQEEIKEVFEGSCKLLPVKVVAEACIKVADEFIVELVDSLVSQMNPQIVCSVAGLCNNLDVHRLLDEMGTTSPAVVLKRKPDTCKGCHTVVGLLEKKFHQSSRDHILESFLLVCGRIGSLSDACSNIVVKYFNEIYLHLEENLNPDEFCLMSGECSAKFHTHVSDIEVRPLSTVGVVHIGEGGDDVACDLCKQLVQHFRDILIANTTEIEFKKVLIGICKQTGTFKEECTSIVNEYYTLIYNFLVNDLNGTVVCSMVGICDRPGANYLNKGAPIVPLLHSEIAQSKLLTGNLKGSLQIMQPKLTLLPIERIMPQTLTLLGNTQLCTFCEYFLHFVQKALTDPETEETIKTVVEKACSKLPRSLNDTCCQFVDTYDAAFIALLAQEIDPSLVCPKLSLCPSPQAQNVEIFMHHVKGDKPDCPLCLLAIENVEEMVKSKKTEATLRQALSMLCSHLHGTVQTECNDFVNTYTEQIIDAILAHLTPTEVCEYLHLCKDNVPAPSPLIPKIGFGGNVDTNEIPDSTAYGKVVPTSDHSPLCVICEFVLSEIDSKLSENRTEEEVKKVVLNICDELPKSVSTECSKFVNQYAEIIISYLLNELDPSQVCAELKLCPPSKKEDVLDTNGSSAECKLCKKVLHEIEHLIANNSTGAKIVEAVEHVCEVVPKKLSSKCKTFINKHGKDIIKLLLSKVPPQEVCKKLQLCEELSPASVEDIKSVECELCKKVLKEVEHLLVGKKTEEQIIHAVDHACKAIPKLIRKDCDRFIKKHGAEIIKLLEDNVVPKEVCKMLQLCNERMSESSQEQADKSYLCLACRWMLQKFKTHNITQEGEIFHQLYDICRSLPPSPKDCNHTMEDFDKNLQLIDITNRLEKARREIRACAVCNVAIHHMHAILQSNRSQQNALDTTCKSLKADQELCETMMIFNGELLYKILMKANNPNLVCSEAGLCPKSQLLGQNRCTWGPGYWCVNQTTAQECGMVAHCQQNVWNNSKTEQMVQH